MGFTRRELGKIGEKIAGKHLHARGFSILQRNFPTPFGEIDLVTREKESIVFFEIKTRVSERFGAPLEAITAVKKRHILKNCLYYLNRFGLTEATCRIDAIGIKLDSCGKLECIKHVRNAIEAQ